MSQSTERNNQVIEIDILKLITSCLKKWWLFLLVMGIFGAGAYIGTKTFIAPTYESTVKIYVNNTQISGDSQSVTTNDMTASAKLLSLYKVILNTRDTLEQIIEDGNLNCTPEELSGMLSANAVSDTQIFRVTVTSTSPQFAQKAAEAVGNSLPGIITDIIERADAKVVETAVVPTEPSGPASKKNAMIAAMLGFVIVFVWIFIRMMLDIEIHDEGDILEVTDYPILAQIPDLTSKSKTGYYAKSSRK